MHYLGIDVAKAKLDCCLLLELQSCKRKTKSFSNNNSGFTELVHWLDKQRISASDTHAVMEGSGVYHERAAISLHEAGMQVSIINPAQARDFAKGLAIRSKTDGLDSLVLARYGALVQPAIWIPPTPQARALQALLSRVDAVQQDLLREQNRQEKADATDTPELIRQSLADSIMFLQTQLKKLQQDIDDHVNRHPELRDDAALLVTIPGIGIKTSQHLLSVIHLHHFHTAERLAAYLGVVPIQRPLYLAGRSYPRQREGARSGSPSSMTALLTRSTLRGGLQG
ncbi:IS110 family transposase [Aeromonas aquatilis]